MKPDPPKILLVVAGALFGQLLPEVRTPFGQQTVTLAGGVLGMIAQEYDRAAARLVEENEVLVALLGTARPVVTAADLRERIESATAHVPARDLHVSALQAANDGLRSVLIDVQAEVESLAGTAARAVNGLIWEELRESTRRRHLETGRG
jgi:hypothetical protein